MHKVRGVSAEPRITSVAGLLEARRGDDGIGLMFEDRRWSWAEVYDDSALRARLVRAARQPGPFHIGVLLDNVPEYLWWLGAAAMAGATVVGINPTRRGEELARDIRFTDSQLIITDRTGAALLDGVDIGIATERVWLVDSDEYAHQIDAARGVHGSEAPAVTGPFPHGVERGGFAEDLLLLLFTSGTTGAPKAVRCTQRRLALIAERAATGYGYSRQDICYCPMPLFHGNAIMALWAPALARGATVALTRRFSASRFLTDVRHYGATRFTYVGTALAYVLATAEHPDDADNPLRVGFGTEASAPDRARFERRFGCVLVEGYGSSEGGTAVNVTPDTPAGALGIASSGDDLAIVDPSSGRECPRACFDAAGRFLNPAVAVGEMVNRTGSGAFEGYYKNTDADAQRSRQGWYWTGDLGYRDEAGYFYFAGRQGDWMRVDSENFSTAPVERVIERHPDVSNAAVYAVADTVAGDQVMAAVELRPGAVFDPDAFWSFLVAQPDLGTKWAPRFVRVCPALPLTATGKVTKKHLQSQAWECGDPVFWVPDRRVGKLRALDEDDRRMLRQALADHGRLALLEARGDGTVASGGVGA